MKIKYCSDAKGLSLPLINLQIVHTVQVLSNGVHD